MKPATGSREIWLAQTDYSAAPQRLTASGEDAPFFGIDGRIFFRASEGQNNYLFEWERDGRHRKKVRAEPIVDSNGHSADRRWGSRGRAGRRRAAGRGSVDTTPRRT